jgi:hypothetical protein
MPAGPVVDYFLLGPQISQIRANHWTKFIV